MGASRDSNAHFDVIEGAGHAPWINLADWGARVAGKHIQFTRAPRIGYRGPPRLQEQLGTRAGFSQG